MNLSGLEAEALKLSAEERARLAETLLKSLEALSDEENRRLWLEEATRRDAELDADPSSVLYRVREDHIRILAIGHQKRRPFYWRGRR